MNSGFINSPPGVDGAAISDFWAWAFSDLCDDGLKGIFAEWLVIRLIGHLSVRRVSWANSDIILNCGLRIEVKATAFWQSWKFIGEDGHLKPETERSGISIEKNIKFAGLRAKNSLLPVRADEGSNYKSDIYVFCLQNERNLDKWNAFDMSQWEFYILSSKELKELNTSSVTLTKLRKLQSPIFALGFKERFEDAVFRFRETC